MSAYTSDIRKRLSEALEEYDDKQADKAMSSGKPRSWNPNALRIYLQQVNYIMDDIERGADPRSAITAGMTGSVLSYVLRKLKMRPPSRDEYTGAGRMVYRPVSSNPPMYAHHLNEIKTHGLSVKQLRRLYAMVSRGSQKAITYARNVFGIPFDETASQVKAVVKHHLIDVGAGRVRRNPYKGFVGKGEYVWKKLTPSQRLRFIMESPRGRQSTPRSVELLASSAWNFLPRGLKIDLQARFANVESDELVRNPAEDVTPVVFRTFRSGGDVIALFPFEPGTNDPWTMLSYQHIGQHGSADHNLTHSYTRASTPDEIRPLKKELEQIGYKLKIITRIPNNAWKIRDAKIRRIK